MIEASGQSIRAAKRGDPEAIRALWRSHRRWVACVLLARKPREVELDDLLQEVALAMVESIRTLRDDAAVEPWLRTIAINTALVAGRKATRRKRLTPVADVGESASAATGPEGESGRRLLDLALSLDEGAREPLLLRCVHGLSYRRIGLVMGLSEQAVQTRVSRARRALRELAAQDGMFEDELTIGAHAPARTGPKP